MASHLLAPYWLVVNAYRFKDEMLHRVSDWVGCDSEQGPVESSCEHGNEHSASIKRREILE
jgi:hypothetical protein